MNALTAFYISFSLLFAFFGLFVGSFLNVCIYRIPLNQTIVSVPSHCTSCNHKLAWYDLFPLFSYLFLKGKCRYCGEHISAQYPLVEALNAIAWGIMAFFTLYNANNNFGWQTILTVFVYCLFASSLIVLSGIDIYYQIVPDRVNIFIFCLGILATIADYTNWASHVIGFFAISLPMLVLMLLGGMGGGDMKLYAAAGFLMGWQNAVLSLILACLLGSVISLPTYITQKKKGVKHPLIPFVPFIAAGMFIAVLWGDSIISWYITTFFGNLINQGA